MSGAIPVAGAEGRAVAALWLGGGRTEVVVGGNRLRLGGPGDPTPAEALLAGVASAQAQQVARRAAELGVELHELWVEAVGEPDGSGVRVSVEIRPDPALAGWETEVG